MKKFSTWLLVMFMIMYWLLRLVVAVTAELDVEFGGIVPLDMTIEVVLLFLVLLCLVFVIKRNIVGALMYVLTYGLYFGTSLVQAMPVIIEGNITPEFALNTMVSAVGIAIPVCVLIDLLLDKNRKAHPVDKKTDWFYKNEQFDRDLDERADKNNYRTL